MVEAGQVLLDKYRVERVLGKGGMGMVVLVQHIHLGEPMAIKLLQGSLSEKPAIVKRFQREARAAARLRSEHICRVFDVGELPDGAPYMVMEYLQGRDLQELVRERGRLPVGMVIDLVLQACTAMAEAHAAGIVHRDIKPANFFLTERSDGSALVKLLDFGVSKIPRKMDVDLTSTEATLGTPAYMSPEQLRSSKSVDFRTDIWSIGVTLYELLSGTRPFRAETFSALCLKVAMEPVPPMTVALPKGLEDVVMRCLEKDPERRYANVSELAAALEPYAHATGPGHTTVSARTASVLGVYSGEPLALPVGASERMTMPRATSEPLASTLSSSSGQATVRTPVPTRRGRRWGVIVAALAVVSAGALAVAASSLWQDRDEGRSAATVEGSLSALDGGASRDTQVVDTDTDTDRHTETLNAGVPDAGVPDAGVPDAEVPDAATSPRIARKETGPKKPPVAKNGTLVLTVTPWAEVYVNGKPRGEAPTTLQLPPGAYRIKLVNEPAGRNETVRVRIQSGKSQEIKRRW